MVHSCFWGVRGGCPPAVAATAALRCSRMPLCWLQAPQRVPAWAAGSMMGTQDLGSQLLQYKGTLRTLIWLFKTDQPDAWYAPCCSVSAFTALLQSLCSAEAACLVPGSAVLFVFMSSTVQATRHAPRHGLQAAEPDL